MTSVDGDEPNQPCSSAETRAEAARNPCHQSIARLGRIVGHYGIRHHAQAWEASANPSSRIRITPHVFRRTTAVHLLEAGVEVNVIRGWLGHVSLNTTNRYAELTLRAKAAALRACEPACAISAGGRNNAVWKHDRALLDWLNAL